MPNFSSDDPLLFSFEIKPKAAYLEHVTQSNGECRQVNKFNVIQQLHNRSHAYQKFDSVEFYKEPTTEALLILLKNKKYATIKHGSVINDRF